MRPDIVKLKLVKQVYQPIPLQSFIFNYKVVDGDSRNYKKMNFGHRIYGKQRGSLESINRR